MLRRLYSLGTQTHTHMHKHTHTAPSSLPRVHLPAAPTVPSRDRSRVLDCVGKQCRALQRAGWEKDPAVVDLFATASDKLVRLYLEVNNAALFWPADFAVFCLPYLCCCFATTRRFRCVPALSRRKSYHSALAISYGASLFELIA